MWPELLGTIAFLLLVLGCQLWQKARRISNIPGNLGTPIIGNLYHCLKNYWHTWHPSFHKYLEESADKYGKVYCFWLCHEVSLGISDPFLMDKLAFHPAMTEKSSLVFDRVGWFMRSTFSFVPSDKEWKLRRKELNNSLKKSRLESFHDTFVRKAKKAVELFSKKSGQFDCSPSCMMLPIEAIGETHFGLDLDIAKDEGLYKDLHFSAIFIAAMLTNPILGLLVIAVSETLYYPGKQNKFENMVYEAIMNKVNKISPNEDIKNSPIAINIAMRHLERKTVGRALKREFTELIYVGAHTIGTAFCSSLVFLATNPEIQEKVWKEQQEIFEDSDRDPTPEDLDRMEYLERFYKEVLRFTAPPITVKTATSDVEIDGMFIPAGTQLIINSKRMRFDEGVWKNPKIFDPDRFLPENIENVPKASYAFYGFGIRACPGVQYANYTFKVMLSTVLRNFKIHSSERFNDLKYYEFVMRELQNGYNISVEKRRQKVFPSKGN